VGQSRYLQRGSLLLRLCGYAGNLILERPMPAANTGRISRKGAKTQNRA